MNAKILLTINTSMKFSKSRTSVQALIDGFKLDVFVGSYRMFLDTSNSLKVKEKV